MVTDQYSHILDDDRKRNAQLFEDAFYQKKGSAETDAATVSFPGAAANQNAASAEDRQLLEKLMEDKSTAELLIALVKKLT